MLGGFLAVRPLNSDEIFAKNDDNGNWVESGALSSGRCRPCDYNDNDDKDCEEDTKGSEKDTGTGKGTTDGKGKGKPTEDGNGDKDG